MTPMEHLRAAMTAVDAYYKEHGIFQGRFGFGANPALIVIDMAYGWTDPAYAGGSARLDSAIAAIQPLLAVALRQNVADHLHDLTAVDNDAAEIGRRLFARVSQMGRTRLRHRRTRQADARRLCRLQRIRQRFRRHRACRPFDGAPDRHAADHRLFDERLRCATATDAKTFHLSPIIIREAVQDRSEIAHEWTLFDIQARFADVASLEETLAYLRTSS